MGAELSAEILRPKASGAFHTAEEVLAIRQAIRSGVFATHTSGLAGGNVQGNVVILPKADAADFLRFCHQNRKPFMTMRQKIERNALACYLNKA